MDPLSAAASIVAVMQLSSEVIKFINAATGATKERKRLREEIRACEHILQQLKDEADDSEEGKSWSETIETLEGSESPLGRLRVALDVIRIMLEPKKGIRKAITTLTWPFNAKEAAAVIAAIEREKLLLNLALTNNCRKLILSIKNTADQNGVQLLELIAAFRNVSKEHDNRLGELRTDLRDFLTQLSIQKETKDSAKERGSILNWLATVDYSSQQRDFIKRRREGTGQWFLESTELRKWMGAEKQILFCPGIPGAGKTILASMVVEMLTTPAQSGNGIAYIYFNFRSLDEQNVVSLFGSLLKQLSQSLQSLPESVRYLYYRREQAPPSLDGILKALEDVAAKYSRVFIVLDALDECRAQHRSRFLSELFKLQTRTQMNILATSRFIPEIVDQFKGSPQLEIRAHPRDVEGYLEGQLDGLPSFVQQNRSLQEEIKTGISEAVDGMFLLAQIYIGSLDDKLTLRAIRSALKSFQQHKVAPKEEADTQDLVIDGRERQKIDTLSHAYDEVVERIQAQKPGLKDLATKVLLWIVHAKRPMLTLELQHALAVEVGVSQLDHHNLIEVKDMVSVCAGLVTIDEATGVMRLVHYTTQEYFEHAGRKWLTDAASDIATTCLAYLSFTCFDNGPCPVDDQFEERLRVNHLYDYAARYWGYHARNSMTASQGALEETGKHTLVGALDPGLFTTISNFIERESHIEASIQALFVMERWYRRPDYSQQFPKRMNGSHVAAYFGLADVVKSRLSNQDELSAEDSLGRTPLSWAAENGHETVVQLLLQSGAQVNKIDDLGRSLLYAAHGGHTAVVKLLINANADANSKDEDEGQTPLIYASREGYEPIVGLLLEAGAEPDLRDNWNMTPLLWATQRGQVHIIRALLKAGADVNLKDSRGRAALVYATIGEHKTIVELLLSAGAEVNDNAHVTHTQLSPDTMPGGDEEVVKQTLTDSKTSLRDSTGRSSLSWAAESGDEAVVAMLLKAGAEVDSEENFYDRTPLSYAVQEGHNNIVELLLEAGAEARGQWLVLAAEKGHLATAKLLVTAGAHRHSFYQNSLHMAAVRGHENIIKILLEAGTDEITGDMRTLTASLLRAAAGRGQEAIVKLLLELGADVNLSDDANHISGTPLSLAARKGYDNVIKMLLEAEADVDSKDKIFQRTELSYAAGHGLETSTRLLIVAGAYADARDFYGRTPISYAAEQGNEVVTRRLLAANASVNSKNYYGRTPLSWAASKGHYAVVILLLEAGAEVDSRDAAGWTPLFFAIYGRHISVVTLLLDAGADIVSNFIRNAERILPKAAASGLAEVVKQLLAAGVEINYQDKVCRTALSRAAGGGHGDIVAMLLAAGANVDMWDQNKRTPLSWAAQSSAYGIVKALLAAGAEADSKCTWQRTPLSYAAEHGHEDVVRLLLEHGAGPALADYAGRTPLTYARSEDYGDVVTALLEAEAVAKPT